MFIQKLWNADKVFSPVSPYLFLFKFLFLNLNITFLTNPKQPYLPHCIFTDIFLEVGGHIFQEQALPAFCPSVKTSCTSPHSLFLSQVVLPLPSLNKALLGKSSAALTTS